MIVLALFSAQALAAPYEVEALWVRGPTGAWVETDATGQAWRVGPNGEDLPMRKGDLLPAEAELATGQARVELRCTEGRRKIEVLPESDLILEDWGTIQEFGAVWYRVTGDFLVVMSRYEALVGGTEFLVVSNTDGEGAVAVRSGKVTVKTPMGTTTVHRHERTQVSADEPPQRQLWVEPGEVRGLVQGLRGSSTTQNRPPADRGLELGGRVDRSLGALNDDGAHTNISAFTRAPVGPLLIGARLGIRVDQEVYDAPVALGLGTQLLGFYGMAELVGTVKGKQQPSPPGIEGNWTPVLHLGPGIEVGRRFELGSHLGISPAVSAAWVDGINLSGDLAVGWRF